MVKDNFPAKEARPLVEIPENIPQIGFLGGRKGKEIDNSIRRDFKDFAVLQVGNHSDDVVKGSNPFYVVAVQAKLPEGVSVATQADLENALRMVTMDFRKTYEDTGLVLRTEEEPNSYLARNLIEQVKTRDPKAKMPVMIPLRGLELERDADSPHGLSFKLGDDVELIYAPILNKEGGGFSSADINDKTGLPKKLGKGDRYLRTSNRGLSRSYLNWDLALGLGSGDLAGSDYFGRVVLVDSKTPEAA
jgi:hypothetical protein